jgi:pentachlorophenol monooxygenase
LARAAVTGHVRLFELLDRRRHTTLIYAAPGSTAADLPRLEALAAAAVEAAHGQMDVYLVADPGADVAETELALIRDSAGEFATRYRPGASAVFAIRPDGYLCLVARDSPTQADLKAALKLTFR